MKSCIALVAVLACAVYAQEGDLDAATGLQCPAAGYMFPDTNNLCIVHFCVAGGEAPIKRACPKGVRVPSWWEGGTLNMCNIVNILKHGGEPTCLRCAADDVQPDDSCKDDSCPAECTCENTEHTHRCDCPVELGVYGADGTVPMPEDHCSPNPCENGASCQNQWDGFFCFCPNGWTGHRCETSVCDWHPCMNGGTCVVDEVGYHCECTECWSGSCCNVTLPGCADVGIGTTCGPCQNDQGGVCVNILDCNGVGCELDDYTNEPKCAACPDCYTGPECKVLIDSCKCNDNCPLNSVCEDLSDKLARECNCNDCWGGEACDVPIVDCTCNNPCPEDQACNMVNGEAVCGCADDCYTGAECDQLVNSCACNNPCEGGECQDSENGPICACGDCMSGEYCDVPVVNCACANPCEEGAVCSENANGELTCGCDDPCKSGPNCDQTVNSCECANPCNPGQDCSKEGDALVCSCSGPCTTGPNCEEKINSCGCSDPCQFGGTCEEGDDGLYCRDCEDCYGGKFCDEPIVSCECNSPCAPGEECFVDNGEVKCECPNCYGGDSCSEKIQSCECDNPCDAPDSCRDSENGPICVCDCVGDEICVNEECVCPDCTYNADGYRGCESRITNLCRCGEYCVEDQQVCIDNPQGDEPTCEIGNPSSGNAFTIVFEENHTEKSLRQIPLEIYMTPSVPDSGSRTVNIRSAGLPKDNYCYFNDTMTIEENSVLRYEVDRCMRHNKTGLDHVSIRITEVNNLALLTYGINKDRWSADGFLATPDVQAGTSFQTASYSPAHRGTQFAIACLYDNTEIEMTLADDNDLPAPYNVKGAVYKLTMNAFETFQVQASCPVQRGSKKSYCSKDLSGTVIKSNKAIHVFSGNIRAFVEAGEGLSRDHLVEELVPTDRWGKFFGLVSVPERAVGDLLNIMALAGTPTTVDIYYYDHSGALESQQISLPDGDRLNKHVQVPSGRRIIVKCSEACSVTQLTKSKDTYLYNNETVHDPVSITIPPTDQFTNNFFFSTPMFTGGETFNLQPYQTNLALVVAEAGTEGDIQMDGAAITDFVMPWGEMPTMDGGVDLVGAVFEIPHGSRLIRNTQGKNFQCVIYGFDDRESYGLPAAMNFKIM